MVSSSQHCTGKTGLDSSATAWQHPVKYSKKYMACRGKLWTTEEEEKEHNIGDKATKVRSKQEVEESKRSCHCASPRHSRGSRDGVRALRVVVTGRISDSFKYQEITAGCWESACSSKRLKQTAHESLTLEKSFVFHTHPPHLFSAPPSISLSFALFCSSLSPADEVSAKTGRRMKGEGWTGRQSWKIKAMKQNVLNRRLEEAARKRAQAQDETSGYELHQLWNPLPKIKSQIKIKCRWYLTHYFKSNIFPDCKHSRFIVIKGTAEIQGCIYWPSWQSWYGQRPVSADKSHWLIFRVNWTWRSGRGRLTQPWGTPPGRLLDCDQSWSWKVLSAEHVRRLLSWQGRGEK